MLTQTSTHVASLTEGEIVVESDLGSIRRVTVDDLPILKGLSIKRLLINPGAMRTPHWHANANELTYCVSGTALVSVLDSGSKFASFVVRTGDVYFVPTAYPHHIEVFDAPEMHFCIFFDQPTRADIGYRASASAYSREVLAAAFDTHIDDLPNFPFTNEDPLIVNRSNPLDAHAIGERTMAS
jgi:oxalate decarboxylase